MSETTKHARLADAAFAQPSANPTQPCANPSPLKSGRVKYRLFENAFELIKEVRVGRILPVGQIHQRISQTLNLVSQGVVFLF